MSLNWIDPRDFSFDCLLLTERFQIRLLCADLNPAYRRHLGITNMRVCDGMVDALPFPDDTFDVTMSGHVVGDDLDAELAELIRVTKNGGWILDCPGDQPKEPPADHALLDRGWEHLPYTGSFGAVVHRYRFRVKK